MDNGSCVSHRTADTDNDTRCSQCIRRGIMTCFYIVPHITCYPCGDDPCDLDTRDDTQDGRQTRGEIALLNNVPTEDAAQTHSYVLRRIGARYARLRTLTE